MAISAVVAAVSTATTVLTGGTLIFGTIAGHFLASTAMGAALNALTPKPKAASANRGIQISGVAGSAVEHQIIYGAPRVGGLIAHDVSTGSENEYRHRVIVFAGHEIDGYQAVYLNDELVTIDGSGNVTSPAAYNGLVRIKFYLGTATQEADPDLIAETVGVADGRWTADHRGRGIAYIYVRFRYNADAFPNGIPSVSARIRGRKVYDPRTGLTAWSDNPALCLRDFITSDFGLGQSGSRIDDVRVAAAANICDQIVSGAKRFTCNGSFQTGGAPGDTASDILSSMGGLLWYGQGQWRMKAASYTAPVITLVDDDLRSGITVSPRHSRRDGFNSVKGVFRGEETEWQDADYPEVDDDGVYLATDNGVPNVLDLALPFTSDSVTAQRVARIALRRNREQLTVTATFSYRAFSVQVGDNVAITRERFGWTAKPFEVLTWNFGLTEDNDLQVTMTLRETSEGIFTEADPKAFDLNNTTLASPLVVPAPGFINVVEELYATREGGGLKALARLSWTAAGSAFVTSYRVRARSPAGDWREIGTFVGTDATVFDIGAGAWRFEVIAVNSLGVSSAASIRDVELLGLSAPPAALAGVSLQTAGGLAVLRWTQASELDVRQGGRIAIRHSHLLTGAQWAGSRSIGAEPGGATMAVLPLVPGSYLLRAEDSTGNVGPITVLPTDGATAVAFANLGLLQEDDEFTGTGAAVTTIAGTRGLVIPDGTSFDTVPDVDALASWDYPSGTVDPSATYTFASGLDLGTVKRVRLRADIALTAFAPFDDFDARPGNVDDWASWDGTDGAEVDCYIEVRTTADDPAGTPTWSDWGRIDASEIVARGIDARAVLSTGDGAVTPFVTRLRLQADEVTA